MKHILYSGLLAAGLLLSFSGFSQRHYAYHRGGYHERAYYRGYGFPHASGFYVAVPAPVIYPSVYPRVYAPIYGYGYRNSYYPGYRRPYHEDRYYGGRGRARR